MPWYLFRMTKSVMEWKEMPDAVLMEAYDEWKEAYNAQKGYDRVSNARDNYIISMFHGETEEEARKKALKVSQEMCE